MYSNFTVEIVRGCEYLKKYKSQGKAVEVWLWIARRNTLKTFVWIFSKNSAFVLCTAHMKPSSNYSASILKYYTCRAYQRPNSQGNWDKSLKSFPPCYSQSPLLTDCTPPPPLEQENGLKLVCNVNIVQWNPSLRSLKIMPRNLNEIECSWIRFQYTVYRKSSLI